ncbi:MAG: transglutaminase domain-containing protein, partial [Clostridia bacterium]|nr:transglutaminase domain-containing protein [Clostridia bacterium]
LTYDGAAHTSVDVTLAPDSPYPLATPRHALRVRDIDAPVFTDAGSYINDPVISVYDSRAGVFVTENYEITRYEGTVTIEKRPLHVQLNGEKMYDGKPMGESDYRIAFINGTSPAVGHTVNAQPTEIHYGSAYTMKSSIEQSTLTIRDGYGRNVRKNYDVHFYEGSLTVTRRPISLVTASAEKIYDGTPLVAYDVILSPESLPLVNGDEVLMVVSGSQTEVGQSPNTAHPETFVICDVLGQDATENYELISVTEGTLTVKYDTVVTVITAGAQKLYDGRPLTCPEYETIMDGEPLPEGYRLSVTVTGSRLGVGKSPNTAEVAIYDDQGLDVTHLFTVQIRPGILTVLEDRDSVFGRVFSRKSGLVYLRNASYGGYTGQGWSAAIPYAGTLSGGYSLNLLPAAALSYLGLVESTTLTFADMGVFLLPYYAEIGGGNPVVGSDTDYSGMELSDYTVSFYMVADTLTLLSGYNQVPSAVRPYLLGQYASAERAYRQFVHANYLEMDSETRAFMENNIALQGFDPADPNVVEAVARYIRAAAVYSLDYDTALDTEDNMAVAFLRDYREGVCVHYATAATLLYRALGIPARYVTGFALEVTANGWTEIRNPGHAWVEVYVDGLGWIPVEVTGSAAEPSPPSGEDPKPTETLELEPVFRYKVYDGDYLYPLNQLEMTPSLKKYLDLGYTYEVEIMGNRREVGDGESYVSYFILYDPTGRDVTDQFILEKKTGVLRVVEADIRVSLYPVEKTYDGTYTRWGEGDYLVFSLPEGCTLELTVLLRDEDFPRGISVSGLNTRRDHVATYRVLRGGEDVTHNYELIFVSEWNLENGGEPPLRILPRVLELTAASETRVDNGTPLENHTVYLTKGTLAPGHKLVTSVSGCLTAVGEAENVISSVRVLDDRGRDVTFLYSITTVSGRLVLVEDTDRST